jgi:MoaA/NifB/PqqE/SkfB family radical SAM enzyme
MYKFDQIRHVHLEISSRCNANCPLCPRSFFGYPHNNGFTERDLTLADAQRIFEPEFIKQLDELYINGNFGDVVMNLEAVDIIEYFKLHNPRIHVMISTNGGARNKKFWQDLARLNAEIYFCIDGLEDTHHLYRQNTLYSTVIQNARTFIAAGGRAVWRMIDFDHNKHQQAEAQQLRQQLGFTKFQLTKGNRVDSLVFNKDRQLTHTIGNPTKEFSEPDGSFSFDRLWDTRINGEVLLEDIVGDELPKPIECEVEKKKSVYVSSTGDVYPCCYLGFEPKTFGQGQWHQAINAQFKHMIKKNNALEHSLAQCIEWFEEIEKTWAIPTFEQGRVLMCNRQCGNCGSSLGKSAV